MIVGDSSHPCDDEYRHEQTGARLATRTTVARHFNMPARVGSAAELRRLSGVGAVREVRGSRR